MINAEAGNAPSTEAPQIVMNNPYSQLMADEDVQDIVRQFDKGPATIENDGDIIHVYHGTMSLFRAICKGDGVWLVTYDSKVLDVA